MIDAIWHYCAKCLSSFGLAFWVYALLVSLVWGFTRLHSSQDGATDRSRLPQPPTDLPFSRLMRESLGTARSYLRVFHPSNFDLLVYISLFILRKFYDIRLNSWDYLRSLKISLILYFVIVPLPAAFMPPVGRSQAAPDGQLLVATLLLILVNAVGDSISVNVTVRNYERALRVARQHTGVESVSGDDTTPVNATAEVRFYLMTVIDLALAATVLVAVLMASSVLFGIQVDEYDFASDPSTISAMKERALAFWSLTSELYWFRDSEGGFLGQPGIPGMFVFAVTTFLPTFVVGTSAILWTLVLPIRIVLGRTRGRLRTLVTAQVTVFVLCFVATAISSIDYAEAYGRLITK